MPRTLRAAAAAAAVAAAVLAPTAAHADRWGSPDPRGDVDGWHYDPEPAPCGTVTDVYGAADTNDDITRLKVRHTRTNVKVTVRFRDLDPELEQWVSVHLATPRRGWFLDIGRYQLRSGNFRVATFFAKEPKFPDPEDADECGSIGLVAFGVHCRTSPEVDLEADVVRATVPRSCLRNPRWVRVGADAFGFVEPEDPEDKTFGGFSDEWGVPTADGSPWLPPFGPRVRAAAGAETGARTVERTAGLLTGVRRTRVISPSDLPNR